jgi:hypothetical protein
VTSRSSPPLDDWHGDRRRTVETFVLAHASLGDLRGSPHLGRPLEHAFILRMISEFQGFVRDLHELAVGHLVAVTKVPPALKAVLVSAMTAGRGIDRGNAVVATMESDFGRLGVHRLSILLGAQEPRWSPPPPASADKRVYEGLISLRNALAHGNQSQLNALIARGASDTIDSSRAALSSLDRFAGALDRVVWDHVFGVTRKEPW